MTRTCCSGSEEAALGVDSAEEYTVPGLIRFCVGGLTPSELGLELWGELSQ